MRTFSQIPKSIKTLSNYHICKHLRPHQHIHFISWFYENKTRYKYSVRGIGLMSRVFANGQGNQGSIPGRVIPKTQKMVLEASLLNTQHYKVRIKGKMEQSREWSSTLHYTFGCPRGVMVKAMNCGIVVRKFVLQLCYYVHFRANTLGKGMNPLILPPAMGK